MYSPGSGNYPSDGKFDLHDPLILLGISIKRNDNLIASYKL